MISLVVHSPHHDRRGHFLCAYLYSDLPKIQANSHSFESIGRAFGNETWEEFISEKPNHTRLQRWTMHDQVQEN